MHGKVGDRDRVTNAAREQAARWCCRSKFGFSEADQVGGLERERPVVVADRDRARHSGAEASREGRGSIVVWREMARL